MARIPNTTARKPAAGLTARRRRLARLTVVGCLLALTAPANAWTGTTERAVLARALGTMPRSLRLVITNNRRELYRATRAGSAAVGPVTPDRLAEECGTAIRMIRQRRPFALTARQLGRVGVMVAATADPYLASAGSGAPAPAHQGFQQFTERMLHLIPFVILEDEGTARRNLLGGKTGLDGYLRHGTALSAGYGRDLEIHVPGVSRGVAPWTAFDARSTPFGIASVSVSRAACRVSAVWLWIWQQAGGETGFDRDIS